MRLLTETDTLSPLWLDLLNLLSPGQHPALQTVPVRRLSCGLDSPQFPSRGSRADVFRPPEVLLTFPGLPDCAAPPLDRPRVSWPAWISRPRRWFIPD